MTEPLIASTALTKRYADFTALDAFDLELGAGESVVLLGGNGAGKTTFIELCLGFAVAESGRLRVAGADPATDPMAARAACAYLPEQFTLYESLTARETLAYFAALAGRPAPTTGRTEALLAEAGLAQEAIDRRVGTYSKGMRQRLALAVALARGARIALLDEPTTGLDPGAIAGLARTLRELAARGVAVLIATHDLAFARAAADRAVVMRAGRVLVRADCDDPRGLPSVYAQATGAAA